MQDRKRIDTGLPPLPPLNKPPPPVTPTPRPVGRPIGTTGQAKRSMTENKVRMKNKINDMYWETQQLPVGKQRKLVDIIKNNKQISY